MDLIAAEPLVTKPIALDWDPAGRLWVAETPEYPFRRSTTGPTHDRISILTDTNRDGVMDTKQVFHEGLHLVTSLVLHRDGVLVAQAPDILWIRDTDGDGRMDRVTIFADELLLPRIVTPLDDRVIIRETHDPTFVSFRDTDA